MDRDYQLQLGVLGWADEWVAFDAAGDREAVFKAFGATTSLGHALCDGRRFLGYFEAGSRVASAEPEARPRPLRPLERRL